VVIKCPESKLIYRQTWANWQSLVHKAQLLKGTQVGTVNRLYSQSLSQ
jgi:hypothetical protein